MVQAITGQVSRSAAEVYDELFVPALFAQFTGPVLDAAPVRRGQAVLDVGCGTGVLAAAAAARVGEGGSVTGVDINAGMLAVAARRRSGISWREADAQDLPFESGTFDAVLSQFSLMFVPDPVRALEEMARVGRAGGGVTVAVWAPLDESPGYASLARVLHQALGAEAGDALAAPFALGDPAVVGRLFSEAGLDAEVTRQVGVARFASLEEWLSTEIRGWTLADVVDDPTLTRLIQTGREPLDRFVGTSGQVVFPVTALVATATVG